MGEHQCSVCHHVTTGFEQQEFEARQAADQRLRNLLLAASRYVQGYHETERNHPQARDGAWNLLQSIKAALNG